MSCNHIDSHINFVETSFKDQTKARFPLVDFFLVNKQMANVIRWWWLFVTCQSRCLFLCLWEQIHPGKRLNTICTDNSHYRTIRIQSQLWLANNWQFLKSCHLQCHWKLSVGDIIQIHFKPSADLYLCNNYWIQSWRMYGELYRPMEMFTKALSLGK